MASSHPVCHCDTVRLTRDAVTKTFVVAMPKVIGEWA